MVCCLAMMSKYACLCIAPEQFMNVELPTTAGAAKILAAIANGFIMSYDDTVVMYIFSI